MAPTERLYVLRRSILTVHDLAQCSWHSGLPWRVVFCRGNSTCSHSQHVAVSCSSTPPNPVPAGRFRPDLRFDQEYCAGLFVHAELPMQQPSNALPSCAS